MLSSLAICDFAIIDAAEIAFGPGLNVLTGETGAGKSILIDALGAVLGDRVSPVLVRTGSRSASVDATFDLTELSDQDALARALDGLEIELDDGQLILSREIQSGGRSTARINGRPTTAAILGQIGGLLVDVHGQSDHLSLLKPSAQLELLDRYARTFGVREEVAQTFGEWRRVLGALAEARSGARELMQRIDLLRYQIDEIAQAALREDEEAELTAERNRLANADRLAQDAALVYLTLAGGDEIETTAAAMPPLRQAAQLLDDMATIDEATSALRERLKDLLYHLEDLAAEARTYRDAIEADPARLEAVEERLGLLRQLKRKYGADIPEILAHAQSAQAELARLTGSDVDADALAAQEEALGRQVGRLAGALSQQRQDAARTLATEVEQAIAELEMGRADFAVSIEQRDDPRGVPLAEDDADERRAIDATGIDRVSFLIAPNAGEGLKPLGSIASGGETARLMLALKSILSEADQTPTLIFDEIDVGVGGRSGQVVGQKLWRLAQTHQVMVITHLPQIAALADEHFRISKTEREGRVVSTVEALNRESRAAELAAMLDGVPLSEGSLRNAEAMLERARTVKSA